MVSWIGWALEHTRLVVTGILAVVVLAWAADAAQEADNRREALSGFAGNAKRSTGGWLNLAIVTFLALVGAAAEALWSLTDLVGHTAGLLPQIPVVSASLATVGLGALGISGTIEITVWQFVGVSLLVLLVAVAWRRRADR